MKTSISLAVAAFAAALSVTPAAAQSLPGERPAAITAIPGVIAPGAAWELVTAGFNNMDGLVPSPDGGVLFAQEQTHTIRRIDQKGQESVYLTDTHGGGGISIDTRGRYFMTQRTCTDPGLRLGPACQELTMVSQVLPERRMLSNSFADGRTLGRVNDVMADGRGGAFFTGNGGVFHASADGVTTVVADQDIRSNGLILSRDGRTLYVTNNTNVLAFDVQPDGSTRNRRVFAELDAEGGGDGSTIDNEGRLYITGASGVHVIDPQGRKLGVIPTPRRPITVTFSGPDKRTLYVVGNGAVGPDGKAWSTPEGIRNTAMTLYKIPMQAQGFLGRPK